MITDRSVFQSDHWLVRDADLYRAIPAFSAFLPDHSLIGLSEGSPPRALRDFIAKREVRPDPAVLLAQPKVFRRARFLPADQQTMTELAALAENCAQPEIAVHLVALHSSANIVEWYDIPDDPLGVTSTIAEDKVLSFASAVGGRFDLVTVERK